jgi:SAM-dependent methyltransferase
MRQELSDLYLSGNGIEIGALCHPLLVKNGQVTYIDRFDMEGLHEQYPTIPIEEMHEVDVVDDGEKLESVLTVSQDFVIANHYLEHCKNPIRAIRRWLEVLSLGGKIFCAVPNKEECFDALRATTTLEHLMEEYTTGYTNDGFHMWENGLPEDSDYSIHYHCWTRDALKELLDKLEEILPIKILFFDYTPVREEFIFIGEKK